jgi:hypothetical protein
MASRDINCMRYGYIDTVTGLHRGHVTQLVASGQGIFITLSVQQLTLTPSKPYLFASAPAEPGICASPWP